ncbi:hypothetical protein C548_108 [Candidatus Portiera aleyrodidarum BT-QVLC]|nr:hypothetical protein C548_108 [Candidatus Portiera aleyrodidarum BT-QVLC]
MLKSCCFKEDKICYICGMFVGKVVRLVRTFNKVVRLVRTFNIVVRLVRTFNIVVLGIC